MKTSSFRLLFILGILFGSLGCSAARAEEADASRWPQSVRADYRVFAFRCSKCHSLARPLNSGIDSDEYWKRYVERMRRQPGSGISLADTVPILRFLHEYALEQRRLKERVLPPQPSTGTVDGEVLSLAGAKP